MKQAKYYKINGHSVCGNCAKMIRVRGEANKVACTVLLDVLPADHVADCEHYEPGDAQSTALKPVAVET